MDGQDWAGWAADEPDLPGDGDTAELGDAGFGAGDPAAAELVGDEMAAPGEDPGEPPGDDAFGAGPAPEAAFGELAEPGDAPGDPAGAPVDEGGDAPGEPPAGAGFAAEPVVGADPDLDPQAEPDPGWAAAPFPPPLELAEAPEPVDGFPWTDAQTLGEGATPLPDPAGQVPPAPPVAQMYDYAGQEPPDGGGGWSALAESADPATSALARFWGAAEG